VHGFSSTGLSPVPVGTPQGGDFYGARPLSSDALLKIDNLTPIKPRINPTDRSALRAFQVRRYIVPIPFGQIGKLQPAGMMAAATLRPKAVDQNSFEAVVPLYRAGPIPKEMSRLPTPRHRASKRR
jgi:hypothetical protein